MSNNVNPFDFARDFGASGDTDTSSGLLTFKEHQALVKRACENAYQEGLMTATKEMEEKSLDFLETLSTTLGRMDGRLTRRIGEIEREAFDCALAIGEKLASVLDAKPAMMKLDQAIMRCLSKIAGAAFLIIKVPDQELDQLKKLLMPTIERIGLTQKVSWQGEQHWDNGKYAIEWDQGALKRDPEALRHAIDQTIDGYCGRNDRQANEN